MTSRRPKDIGTAAETAVVRYLRDNGFPNCERRALHGNTDLGDITGTPGLVWEVKGGDAAKTASDRQVLDWLFETETERSNANAAYGILITARHRKATGDWWAHLWADQLTTLCGGSTADMRYRASDVPLRVTLADLVILLADAGWADERAEVA